ncbi:hypothetical protein WAK64_07260 [Bacillus spongiae]|uniref:DUF4178 domain-containing protein n=1 Tax=Bacillus spongiae TaxID=2683610 RepID=A0ABU8HC13_9BACI
MLQVSDCFVYYLNLAYHIGETAILRREKLYPDGIWRYEDYNVTESGVWSSKSDWDTLYRMKIIAENTLGNVTYVTPYKYYYMPKPLSVNSVAHVGDELVVDLEPNKDSMGNLEVHGNLEFPFIRIEKKNSDGVWEYLDYPLYELETEGFEVWRYAVEPNTEYRVKVILKDERFSGNVIYDSEYVYYTVPSDI